MMTSFVKKAQVLDKLKRKELTVTSASKKLGVSRQTIYLWLDRLADLKSTTSVTKKVAVLRRKDRRVWYNKQFVDPWVEAKVLAAVKGDPDLSLLELQKYMRNRWGISLSRHGIYNCLLRNNLVSIEARSNFSRVIDKLTPEFRQRMVDKAIIGKYSITQVANEYKISRQQLYDWMKRYQTSGKSGLVQKICHRKTGLKADTTTVGIVLDYISRYPHLSYAKLYGLLKSTYPNLQVGRHGLYNIYRIYNLRNIEDRLIYSRKFAPLPTVTPTTTRDTVSIPSLDQQSPQVLPGPPPPRLAESRLSREEAPARPPIQPSAFLPLPPTPIATPFRKQLGYFCIFFGVGLGFVFGIGEITLTLISAQSPEEFIGYLFASIALSMGTVFFLYSMKYYFSILYVLFFSRNQAQDDSSKLTVQSSKTESQTLAREDLLKANNYELRTGSSLIPDLTHIQLTRHPFVSIHIPLYNEKRVVNRLLEAVTSMDYDQYEVVICDDSTDETKDIVQEWKNHPLIKISHRETREGFKGGALKEAVNLMDKRAEFVIVFDADFLPYPDTITQFLKNFQVTAGGLDFNTQNSRIVANDSQIDTNLTSESVPGIRDYSRDIRTDSRIAAIQGYQWHVLNKSENWITRGVRTEYAGSYVIERSGTEIYQGLKQIAGSVFMIRADILRLPQYQWGTSITEDFELTLKLYRDGYKVAYTPYIQAPSECVSTLKRLIRQRMRWAEGHSHNIRKLFKQLMFGRWVSEDRRQNTEDSKFLISNYSKQVPITNDENLTQESPLNSTSNSDSVIGASLGQLGIRSISNSQKKAYLHSRLTLSEKLEFLYLAPYYLQSAFFLVGTFSWFVSEAVFKVRLPFWTAIWGWSLVLTNLLSLPLMNTVGLFLEEAEEKDYSGIPSFLLLSYILAPFQAYASIKGFLEDKEGPWFRTPKTGKITDIYRRGRFYSWIKGFFGQPQPEPATIPSVKSLPDLRLYDLNIPEKTGEYRPTKKSRLIGKFILTVSIIISMLTYSILHLEYSGQTVAMSRNFPSSQELISGKHSFKYSENPVFELKLQVKKQPNLTLLNKPVYAEGSDSIETEVIYKNQPVDIHVDSIKTDQGYTLKLERPQAFKPGKYTLKTKATVSGKGFRSQQDFNWGVLAINTEKSTYSPGETIKFGFGMVDDVGRTICDANLKLRIFMPSENKTYELSSENKQIRQSGECGRESVTNTADYLAEFTAGNTEEVYQLELEADAYNGKKTLQDQVIIQKPGEFEIIRSSFPTRIYPKAAYPVKLTVNPNIDFTGTVTDEFPQEFTIIDVSEGGVFTPEGKPSVTWQVNWQKGQSYELTYTLAFPHRSPAYYLIGPLQFIDSQQQVVFNEERAWQIAADAIAFVQDDRKANCNGVSTCSLAFGLNNTAGNLIVVGSRCSGTTAVFNPPTDTAGNSYQTVYANLVNGTVASVYYAENIASGANTVTITTTGTNCNMKLFISEFSGLATSQALDQKNNQNNTNNSSWNTGNVTTTQANELLYNLHASNDTGVTFSQGTNYTERFDIDGQHVQDRIVSATGTYGGDSTASNSTADGVGIIAAFSDTPIPENWLVLSLLSPLLFKYLKVRKRKLKKTSGSRR